MKLNEKEKIELNQNEREKNDEMKNKMWGSVKRNEQWRQRNE